MDRKTLTITGLKRKTYALYYLQKNQNQKILSGENAQGNKDEKGIKKQ